MILESPAEKQRRQINLERKRSNPEEIKVKSLCSKYKDFLAEEIVIVSQYNDFKFAVAERIKSQLVLSFPDIVTFAHQNEQFQDLAKLMDIGGTFLASSADYRNKQVLTGQTNKQWIPSSCFDILDSRL
ncbi:unnamed protein product [Caretta caretta]